MDVAVTGATGHLGGNLVRALLEEGRSVRVLVRSDRRAIDGLPVEVVEGDVLDPEALARLFRGVGTVFHLAARISIVGSEGGLVERTNVGGPRNAVRACREAGVGRLVHVSSIHAFDTDPSDREIDETRAPALDAHHMAYDRSKAMGQAVVLEAVREGLDAVIVNPAALLGPHDHKISRMGEVLLDIYHRRLPALIDGGYNWVDVRDVVSGILAAERRGRTGECYLLTGHWAHVCELSALVAELTGRKTPRGRTPLWLAMVASYPALWWGLLRGRAPKFSPGAIRSIRMHRHISHAKATAELGYEPRPLRDTVRDTLEWFRGEGLLDEA